MSDYDFLRDYADGASLESSPPVTTPIKKTQKTQKDSGKKPWFTKFPPIERVLAMRVQFFDNGPNPGKGHAQHTLKLRVYLDDGMPLNQREPHWYRIVQLIDPKKVVVWAEKEHAAGKLTDANVAHYKGVADSLLEGAHDFAWVKMGHIGSPPGTHYFHNQFVAVCCTTSGELGATLFVEDGRIDIEPFYPNTRSKKAGAPKMHALYDPCGKIAPRGSDDDEL